MPAKVTVEEVERVAELAHLKLTPEESAHMLTDLNAILDHVAELNELDTASVAPLAQVSELGDFSTVLRADTAYRESTMVSTQRQTRRRDANLT